MTTHIKDENLGSFTACGKGTRLVELAAEGTVPSCPTCRRKSRGNLPETVLCAAIYVDTGKAWPERRSYTYPKTGIVFAGWRHGECFLLLEAWAERLTDTERAEIIALEEYALQGQNQGFVTSKGRYVSRKEAGRIAFWSGQIDRLLTTLTSEDLY